MSNKCRTESKKIVVIECLLNEQLACKCALLLSEYKAVKTDDHDRRKSMLISSLNTKAKLSIILICVKNNYCCIQRFLKPCVGCTCNNQLS